MDEDRLTAIKANPIGNGLDGFYAHFASICREKDIPSDSSAVDRLDDDALRDLTFELLRALQGLPASRISPSTGSSRNLLVDISRLAVAVADGVDITCKPLLVAVLEHKHDTEIWIQVYEAIAVTAKHGKPIYLAESPAVLLESIAQFVGGHKALYEAGTLHRNISINTLMIYSDASNLSLLRFLINIDNWRKAASGAPGETDAWTFMSIGVLWGESHSFMDDLESIFWVLFWICVHYDGPGSCEVVPIFEKWNYENDPEELARMKAGVKSPDAFDRTLDKWCTDYYRPLIPCVRNLWEVVFPDGRRWKKEDLRLYGSVQDILREAQKGLTCD